LRKNKPGLYVTGRRPDGYHTLETIFVPVTLFDRIDFIVREKNLTLHCSAPSVPKDETNLVIRAVNAFLKNWGAGPPDFGLEITLKKISPRDLAWEGGPVTRHIRFWPCRNCSAIRLTLRLSGELRYVGRRRPVFSRKPNMSRRGNRRNTHPLDIRIPGRILLVMPEIHISTAEVFRSGNFALTNKNKLVTLSRKDKLKIFFHYFLSLLTSWKRLCFPCIPNCGRSKNSLYSKGAFYAGMTGSGSAFFGIFEGDKKLRRHFFIFPRIIQRLIPGNMCRIYNPQRSAILTTGEIHGDYRSAHQP